MTHTSDYSSTGLPDYEPNETTPVEPGHPLDKEHQPVREQNLEDRIHDVLEKKLVSLLDNESTNREIVWLRRQVNWSIAFLVLLIIVLGGAFTWFAVMWRNEEPVIVRDSSSAIAPIPSEQLQELEAQIQSLNERIPENFPETVTTNQEQLQSLSESLSNLSTVVEKNQQSLTNLETSIQELEESLLVKDETGAESQTLEAQSPE